MSNTRHDLQQEQCRSTSCLWEQMLKHRRMYSREMTIVNLDKLKLKEDITSATKETSQLRGSVRTFHPTEPGLNLITWKRKLKNWASLDECSQLGNKECKKIGKIFSLNFKNLCLDSINGLKWVLSALDIFQRRLTREQSSHILYRYFSLSLSSCFLSHCLTLP